MYKSFPTEKKIIQTDIVSVFTGPRTHFPSVRNRTLLCQQRQLHSGRHKQHSQITGGKRTQILRELIYT